MHIIQRLENLRAREHAATVEIIEALVECQRSEAYLEFGYGSIWNFLVEHLTYSNAAASRRYKAMKCAARFPQVLDLLREHRTNLSALALAEATLTQATSAEELLGLIDGKSQREVERVIAQEHPIAARRERVRRRFVNSASAEGGLFTAAAPVERVFLSFSITTEQNALLQQAKARISSKFPGALTLERVFGELLAQYLRPTRSAQPKDQGRPDRRRISQAVRDLVFQRDHGHCSFLGKGGRRCGSTHQLQVDHIRPWAMGGSSELANLRLLCARHNRHLAKQSFGADLVPLRN